MNSQKLAYSKPGLQYWPAAYLDAIRNYYTGFSNAKRISTFKSLVHTSRNSYIEDIIFYQILFDTSPSSTANYTSLEAGLYLELNFPDVYSNFLEKL